MPPGQPETSALFGPRPLIAGEDAAAYDDLLARVTREVAPADILEQLWVRDVVDLTWDVLRLRRLKAKLIAGATQAALARLLAPQFAQDPEPGVISLGFGTSPAARLAEKWAARDRLAIKQVDALLAAADLTMDDVMAKCLSLRLDDIERIDRMTMNAEIRRNAALRELDRHRAAAAQLLRRAIDDVEDAEFEVVPPHLDRERSAA
jgi:hypothetical protein